MAGENAPIIIKKIKKGGHGHHGGAWKVAYADFVTAMMAFFLLLWLLNATTDEQKQGIADYFSPASISRQTSGSGGVMGGTTVSSEGALTDQRSSPGISVQLPTAENDPEEITEIDDDTLDNLVEQRDERRFDEAEEVLRQAIESVPELQSLAQHLIIDRTPEGLRIQIVDQAGESMFPSGRAQMYDHTRQLMGLVADAVKQLPNQIAIKGHTDAAPFVSNDGYSNWELSTDRANASRRALIDSGLSPDRIDSVAGRADQEPLLAESPFDAQNRRISIILLREDPPPETAN